MEYQEFRQVSLQSLQIFKICKSSVEIICCGLRILKSMWEMGNCLNKDTTMSYLLCVKVYWACSAKTVSFLFCLSSKIYFEALCFLYRIIPSIFGIFTPEST